MTLWALMSNLESDIEPLEMIQNYNVIKKPVLELEGRKRPSTCKPFKNFLIHMTLKIDGYQLAEKTSHNLEENICKRHIW